MNARDAEKPGGSVRAIRLVILDRDGVINADSDTYIKSPAEFQPFPESLAAIVRLKRAGKLVAIATNQSGIARGYFDETVLHAMHRKLFDLLAETAGQENLPSMGERPGPRSQVATSGQSAIDSTPDAGTQERPASGLRPHIQERPTPWLDYLLYCPHGPDDGCGCRKPRPGMLLEILGRSGVAATEAVFIGDSLSDLQAARAAGVSARLVRTGKGERTLVRRGESQEAQALLDDVSVHLDLVAATDDLVSIALDDLEDPND